MHHLFLFGIIPLSFLFITSIIVISCVSYETVLLSTHEVYLFFPVLCWEEVGNE